MRKIIYIILIAHFSLNIVNCQTGWFWQNPLPQGNTLTGVRVFDANTCVAVGHTSTVMKTTNGGVNWDVQHYSGGISNDLWAVYFIDVNTGWAVGSSGAVIKTTNAGVNWISQSGAVSNDLWAVWFIDNTTGWAAGTTGLIIKTTNSGSNWTTQPTGTSNHMQSLFLQIMLQDLLLAMQEQYLKLLMPV